MEGDGYKMNHEDTSMRSRLVHEVFLGREFECISCHDGAGHLEKIQPVLAKKKRADFWRQASFFGKPVSVLYCRQQEIHRQGRGRRTLRGGVR